MDIASISALITALISLVVAVVSWLRGNKELSLKTRELEAATKKLENDTNTELRKLRTEIQQTYAGLLLQKRLEVYPALYQYLSSFIKVIEFDVVTKSTIQELRTRIEQWDSQYSIYFTGQTADAFHEFRMMVAELSELSNEEIQGKIGPKGKKTTFRRRVAEIELALKSDLGVYIVEFPDEGKERIRRYEDIESLMKQKETT